MLKKYSYEAQNQLLSTCFFVVRSPISIVLMHKYSYELILQLNLNFLKVEINSIMTHVKES